MKWEAKLEKERRKLAKEDAAAKAGKRNGRRDGDGEEGLLFETSRKERPTFS